MSYRKKERSSRLHSSKIMSTTLSTARVPFFFTSYAHFTTAVAAILVNDLMLFFFLNIMNPETAAPCKTIYVQEKMKYFPMHSLLNYLLLFIALVLTHDCLLIIRAVHTTALSILSIIWNVCAI